MQKNSSLLVKLPLATLLVLLSIYVGKNMVFGSGGNWFENLRAEVVSTPHARTISVTADGKVIVKPDIAMVNVSVVETGKNLKDVMSAGNSKMNTLIDEMQKLGIKSEDLKTTSYDLYPVYENNFPIYQVNVVNSAPKIIGYNFSQTLNVKIRELDKVDQVLDKASTNGANQISGISFDVDDKTKLRKEARERAFDEVKKKAEEMAQQAGVGLGKIVTFSEGANDYPPYMQNFRYETAVGASDSAGAAVSAGTKEFSVSVSVTYELN